ncbi:DUF3566 domain-containing protein [Goekera deserti]|nr:DUF3566 domain-containing protein [Goekera deserti]
MSPNDTAQTSALATGAATGTRGAAPAGSPGRTGAGATGRGNAAGPNAAESTTESSGRGRSARGPRRARLQLRNLDTWSALKISLVLSIAFFFVWMVAVGLLYGILGGLGVFDTLNDLIGQLNTTATGGEEAATEFITPGIVFGGAAVIGAINVVLFTALATVGTLMYNLCADLVGGLEVTLAERD